jgi:hypothetical protein
MATHRRLPEAETDRHVADLRADLAAQGWPAGRIADEITSRFPGLSQLKAHRLAHGWTRPHAVSLLAGMMEADGLRAPAWLTGSRLYDWERGSRRPGPESLDLLCRLYETRADRLGYGADYSAGTEPAGMEPDGRRSGLPAAAAKPEPSPSMPEPAAIHLPDLPPFPDQAERLRRELGDVLSAGAFTETALDDWERTVVQHGWDARFVPPASLLADLVADVAELGCVLSRRQPASATRRLTRVAAQMAGLMSLTLVKLGEHAASRGWARTARIAAAEAADGAVQSWVQAREAYTLFYDANPRAAVAAAQEAQALAGRTPCVGVALAAALEARAQATMGCRDAVESALDQAENALARLDPDSVNASALGYSEAQLRFHEGSAWTTLRLTRRAWTAQERALVLYPGEDWMDRTLVQLDRAACLAADGEVEAGLMQATRSLLDLPAGHRTGLIQLRARWLASSIPARLHPLPAFGEFRDTLMLAPAAQPDRREIGHRRRRDR